MDQIFDSSKLLAKCRGISLRGFLKELQEAFTAKLSIDVCDGALHDIREHLAELDEDTDLLISPSAIRYGLLTFLYGRVDDLSFKEVLLLLPGLHELSPHEVVEFFVRIVATQFQEKCEQCTDGSLDGTKFLLFMAQPLRELFELIFACGCDEQDQDEKDPSESAEEDVSVQPCCLTDQAAALMGDRWTPIANDARYLYELVLRLGANGRATIFQMVMCVRLATIRERLPFEEFRGMLEFIIDSTASTPDCEMN